MVNTTTTTEPKWLTLARAELGTKEAPGDANNPRVLQYYVDAGHAEIHEDSTAWCSAAMGSWLKRSGIKPSGSLMAKSYLTFGAGLPGPRIGCIAVLWRGSPTAATGHVGFVTGFTGTEISLLGGNQGANGVVSVETFPRSRVLAYRWPVAVTPIIDTPKETTWSKVVKWLRNLV